MNKEHDCYYTLGLQPGASQTEIKAAYRRLVKLYHPDRDQSLDGEMKYTEIREAYRILLKQPHIRETGTESNSSKQATWASDKSTYQTERTTWTKEEATTHFYKNNSKFKWIFMRFLSGLIGVIPYALILVLVYSDGIVQLAVLATLLSLMIAWGMFFLVSYRVISEQLAARIAIFGPFFLSIWIAGFIDIKNASFSEAIRFYSLSGFFFYVLVMFPTENFFNASS